MFIVFHFSSFKTSRNKGAVSVRLSIYVDAKLCFIVGNKHLVEILHNFVSLLAFSALDAFPGWRKSWLCLLRLIFQIHMSHWFWNWCQGVCFTSRILPSNPLPICCYRLDIRRCMPLSNFRFLTFFLVWKKNPVISKCPLIFYPFFRAPPSFPPISAFSERGEIIHRSDVNSKFPFVRLVFPSIESLTTALCC